jgi:hypothetical protein
VTIVQQTLPIPVVAGPVKSGSARLIGLVGRRFTWGLADRLMPSLSNAAVSLCAARQQARLMPRSSGVREWLSQTRDIGSRYLIENTATSGTGQWRIHAVGFAAGLSAVGYLQKGSLLMGPFFVIFMGISLVTVQEAARMMQRSSPHLNRIG